MSSDPQTVVCFGDSITEGVIGASYVDLLRQRLPAGVRLVNAGINGDTTLNLLRRVERDVVALDPDVVIVLVGLNDLSTAYGRPSNKLYYSTAKNIQVALTPARFARLYRRLLATLRARTRARLALCTLTTVGERLDDPFQEIVETYCTVIRALAAQERLPLIDLRAAFRAAIASDPRDGPPYHIWTPLLDWAAIGLRGANYDQLSKRRGYRLLCDGAHLAPPGADLVAGTILPTLVRLLR
jgi:acyl-CoA thioesterase-1